MNWIAEGALLEKVSEVEVGGVRTRTGRDVGIVYEVPVVWWGKGIVWLGCFGFDGGEKGDVVSGRRG